MTTAEVREMLRRYLNGVASVQEVFFLDSFMEKELLTNDWDIAEDAKIAFGQRLKQRIDERKQ